MKKKILIVFGTRPEAIKMAPVIKTFEKSKKFKTIICVSGQHKEMLNQVINVFDIKPNYDLSIMTPNQTLSSITCSLLGKFNDILLKEKPNLVLVHGDTTTAFVSCLASFYNQIPVGHVEAGLRTYDMSSPFPEEFNRQAIDLVSELYFAPTALAKENLLKENKSKNVFVTGNTVIDALKYTVNNGYKNEILEWAKDSRLVLLTAHRRENLGENMQHIFNAIKRVVNENSDIKVVFPVHLNPKILQIANSIFGNHSRIKLIKPLDVFDFHNFMARAYLVLTDSGGIQEEAPHFNKPVLVLRTTTERPEGVVAGTLKVVGVEEENIYKEFSNIITNKEEYNKMSMAQNPYGDGNASERILTIIEEYFEEGSK